MVDAGRETREEDAAVAVDGDGWCRPSARAEGGGSTAVRTAGEASAGNFRIFQILQKL